eukprot:4823213-Pyramimonas_sp.AAC.1
MLLQAAQEAQSAVQSETGTKKDLRDKKKSQKKADMINMKAPRADLVIDEENDVEFLHHLHDAI